MVIGESLSDAIDKLFTGVGTQLGQVSVGSDVVDPSSDLITDTTSVPSSTSTDTSPEALLRRAEILFGEADAALGKNPPDFATYQKKLAEARTLVSEAITSLGR